MNNSRILNKKEKFFSIIFLLGFLFKYNYLLLNIFNVPSITGVILRNLVFVLFFYYFLLPMAKNKGGRIFLLLLSLIFSTLFMSNLWYNRYFGNYLSITDMIMGEGTGTFSMFSVLIRHIIKPVDIIFLIDIFLLFSLIPNKKTYKISFNTRSNSFARVAKYHGKKSKSLAIIIILLLLISQILITNYLLDNKTPINLYQNSTVKFVNVYGLLPLYFMESYQHLAPERFNILETESESIKAVSEQHLNQEDIMLSEQNLIDNKTNIIMIQLESVDEKLINYHYQGVELTPFLNDLKDESLYFNNFYAQHINGSFDADLATLTSLYPINRNYAFRENDFSNLSSLPKVLKEFDYHTMAFHGNKKGFFSRDLAYPDLGFDIFYSLEDYSQNNLEMEISEDNKLGINDYDFFKQSLDMIENSPEPFFAFMITLSSHTPFSFYPEDQTLEEFADIDDDLIHDFFQSIAFLDSSLEMFLDGLEERGLMENTLIILYSDHESDIQTDFYSSSRDFNLSMNVKAPEHVPLLFFYRGLDSGIIEKAGSFTDLAPTLLDIMGIEYLSDTFIGNSLILEEEDPVLFLHENPQLLYKDNLFVKRLDEFERVGYLDQARNYQVEIPEDKEKRVNQIIDLMRNTIFSRNSNVFGGEQ